MTGALSLHPGSVCVGFYDLLRLGSKAQDSLSAVLDPGSTARTFVIKCLLQPSGTMHRNDYHLLLDRMINVCQVPTRACFLVALLQFSNPLCLGQEKLVLSAKGA